MKHIAAVEALNLQSFIRFDCTTLHIKNVSNNLHSVTLFAIVQCYPSDPTDIKKPVFCINDHKRCILSK